MAYVYSDQVRPDILRMIPGDGRVIGSIGCGYATTEWELGKSGREVHGVDISSEAIAVAAQRLATARVVAPGEIDLFARESLDGLILADVIEHMPMAWEKLKEFTAYVKPGGWVIISVPNMRQMDVLAEFFVRGDWPERPWGIFDRTHLQMMSKKRLMRWCEGAGLNIEQWFDMYDPNGPRRRWAMRTLDILSMKLFHFWFIYELQVCCRVNKSERST